MDGRASLGDKILMLLTILNHTGYWNVLGKVFGIRDSTPLRMRTLFAMLVSDWVYALFVTDLTKEIFLCEIFKK